MYSVYTAAREGGGEREREREGERGRERGRKRGGGGGEKGNNTVHAELFMLLLVCGCFYVCVSVCVCVCGWVCVGGSGCLVWAMSVAYLSLYTRTVVHTTHVEGLPTRSNPQIRFLRRFRSDLTRPLVKLRASLVRPKMS